MELNICAHCGAIIDDVYYSVNGKKICPMCSGTSVSELVEDKVVTLEDLSVEGNAEVVEDNDKEKKVPYYPYGMKAASIEATPKEVEKFFTDENPAFT